MCTGNEAQEVGYHSLANLNPMYIAVNKWEYLGYRRIFVHCEKA